MGWLFGCNYFFQSAWDRKVTSNTWSSQRCSICLVVPLTTSSAKYLRPHELWVRGTRMPQYNRRQMNCWLLARVRRTTTFSFSKASLVFWRLRHRHAAIYFSWPKCKSGSVHVGMRNPIWQRATKNRIPSPVPGMIQVPGIWIGGFSTGHFKVAYTKHSHE